MIVRNKCTQCKHLWRDQPGAFATVKTNYKACCPECGSSYFKWQSFAFDKRKEGIDSDKN